MSMGLAFAMGMLGDSRPGEAVSFIDPATLFAAAEKGGWFDPNNLGSLWQDTAGTVPAVLGSPVGRIDATAGTFLSLVNGTGASQPILRLNGTTGYHYLEFDATDDVLTSPSQTAAVADTATVMAGVVANGSANAARIMGYGTSTQSGTVGLHCAASATFTPFCSARGSTGATATGSNALPGPTPLVLTGQGDISADLCILRTNGVQVASSAADQGTGNLINRVVSVGYSGAGQGLNANWYGGLHIHRALTAQEIDDMEALLAARVGVSL